MNIQKRLEKKRGRFITVEGIDGAGKTTAVETIANFYRELGRQVVVTREPGGCEIGEKIRTLFLENSMCLDTQILLMFAARAQHLEDVIYHGLQRGRIVICDRYVDSTYVYQGVTPEAVSKIRKIEKIVCGGFKPHVTFLLDVTVENAQIRLSNRGGLNSFDNAEIGRKQQQRLGFIRRACESSTSVIIDADRSIESVNTDILKHLVSMHRHIAK